MMVTQMMTTAVAQYAKLKQVPIVQVAMTQQQTHALTSETMVSSQSFMTKPHTVTMEVVMEMAAAHHVQLNSIGYAKTAQILILQSALIFVVME